MSPLSPVPPPLRSKNRKGDLAEAAFVSRALRMGFTICRPINTNSRYDFVVEAAGKYNRIQVKSIWSTGRKPYTVPVRSGPCLRRRYWAHEVDFFALYVPDHGAWYIVPIAEVGERFKIAVQPQTPGRGKFERFREAWHLLLPRGVRIGDLKAMADPGYAGKAEEFQPSLTGL